MNKASSLARNACGYIQIKFLLKITGMWSHANANRSILIVHVNMQRESIHVCERELISIFALSFAKDLCQKKTFGHEIGLPS